MLDFNYLCSNLRLKSSVGKKPEYRFNAYTLVEVMISLFLMTVILMFVGMAIETNLRLVTIERTEVEEAQLARVILEKIARDIRSVVVAVKKETLEVDTSAISSLFGLSAFDAELAALMEPEATSETEDEDAESVQGTMPGIYGDAEWLQIDTALLPRGETFGSKQVRSGSSMQPDRLSPSKTVLYYLGKDTGTLSIDDPRYQPERLTRSLGRSLDAAALQYGLFRRQLDRLVTQYVVNEGLEIEYEQYDEPLAPEVESIEFAYFDPEAGMEGTPGDWIDSWDMDDRQTLPKAIRISVGIRKKRFGSSMVNQLKGYGADQLPTVVYSLIVVLPITIDLTENDETEASLETE